MSRDEAMMFPNDRIRTWLNNNRTNSQAITERPLTDPGSPASEELIHEIDSTDALAPEDGRIEVTATSR